MNVLGKLSLEVSIGDEPVERVVIDLSNHATDMLELVRLEETTGYSTDTFVEMQSGKSPSFGLIRALCWWGVTALFPEADIDYATFTFDMATLETVEQATPVEPEPSAEDVEAELFAGAATATSPKV